MPEPKKRRRRRKDSAAPTLADVAVAAGVSVASASRALANPDIVSDALRARVVDKAGMLNYVAKRFPGLRASGCRCFGALLPDLSDAVQLEALQACAMRLQADGDGLLIALAGADVAMERARELEGRGAVAIARFGVSWPQTPMEGETARTLSFDGEGALVSDSGYCRAEAIALAVLYLGAAGHARVALIEAGSLAAVRAICARRASDLEVIDAGEGGQLPALIAQNPPVTAVVCGSDHRALQLLRLCALNDIGVPHTLAIVGYGDTEAARTARPALTSLRVPAAQAGAVMAARLAAPASAREVPSPLSAKLVVRDSTSARCPAAASGST